MDKAPLTVAMIGVGMVAATHLRALRDARPALSLAGICARRPQTAAAFADRAETELGYRPVIYADSAAVAADPGIDIALILTPPDARLALIAPLARAGKAILLEKPLARNASEARAVVTLCEEMNIPLGVVFQHRVRAASQHAAALVNAGDLGALGLVEMTVPWWRKQAYYDEPGRGTYARDGGGVLISQAIHTIDLALSLTGPVTEVQAMTATTRFHEMEAEDFATAGLRFENGAIGSLVASTASFPGGAETITLHFERASLHLGEGVLTVHWRDGREETHGATAGTGGGADPMAFTHEWHKGILEDFAAALRDGHPPMITGRQALESHLLIDAIALSAREGRTVSCGEVA
ncbi:Gfo/Idh/MocA family protein [Rhodophyticola porphyridii]|uniref:Gfo/Idh/MocA family protein n=1 Tax=Rhodophyticola porphyridii TaxID=1852017 RepID=UPI0035CEDE0E